MVVSLLLLVCVLADDVDMVADVIRTAHCDVTVVVDIPVDVGVYYDADNGDWSSRNAGITGIAVVARVIGVYGGCEVCTVGVVPGVVVTTAGNVVDVVDVAGFVGVGDDADYEYDVGVCVGGCGGCVDGDNCVDGSGDFGVVVVVSAVVRARMLAS